MDFFIEGLKKWHDFRGRANRQQFWMFTLCTIIFAMMTSGADLLLGTATFGGLGLLTCLFMLFTLVPRIALSVRRLHDIGRSGFWLLLCFIPLGGLILIVPWLLKGEDQPNSYGAVPTSHRS